MIRLLAPALLTACLVLPPLPAQSPLSLREALGRADSASFQNRIATGNARAVAAQATAALQGLLPAVRIEGGYVRSDNPLGVFGFTMQQRTVTAAAFDPASLNNPIAASNWNTGLVTELPLVNPEAWFGRTAANQAASAARSGADWTRTSTRLDVVRSYYGAIVARIRSHTLEQALSAATAHQRQAESMVRNGMATPSDALLASVQRGQVEAELVEARGNQALARERLALILGQPGDTSFTLPDSLPPTKRIETLLVEVNDTAGSVRADVDAATLAAKSATSNLRRANAGYLPRLNAFGRYEWNSSNAPFGGDGSYTVGVMASWSPFSGGAQLAARQGAQAQADAAAAQAEAARATAALEIASALSDRRVATIQLGIAETAVDQATDAHRIVGRKYAGGLATVAELLSAAATETRSRLGLTAARYHLIVAEAALRHASGGNLTDLIALEN